MEEKRGVYVMCNPFVIAFFFFFFFKNKKNWGERHKKKNTLGLCKTLEKHSL